VTKALPDRLARVRRERSRRRLADELEAIAEHCAFSRFGKGRHRAGLNYGDCFSYALAIVTGEPLLFTGDDFVHTDVSPVDICSRVTDRLMTRR
jgi:uncharacterized protein with PIN domain